MVYLRAVQTEDMDLLFRWANDPVTRENSFQKDRIPYEDHVRWFSRMMEDPDRLAYILMDEDTAVGQIRVDLEGETGEISYSIAPEQRGKGYGRRILALAEDEIRKRNPSVKKLTARVKPENAVSGHLFEAEGFDRICICYEKSLQGEK